MTQASRPPVDKDALFSEALDRPNGPALVVESSVQPTRIRLSHLLSYSIYHRRGPVPQSDDVRRDAEELGRIVVSPEGQRLSIARRAERELQRVGQALKDALDAPTLDAVFQGDDGGECSPDRLQEVVEALTTANSRGDVYRPVVLLSAQAYADIRRYPQFDPDLGVELCGSIQNAAIIPSRQAPRNLVAVVARPPGQEATDTPEVKATLLEYGDDLVWKMEASLWVTPAPLRAVVLRLP